MSEAIRKLRDKANYYRHEATTAATAREREILLAMAADTDQFADELEARQKAAPK